MTPRREIDLDVGPLQLQDGSTLKNAVQRVTMYGDPSARTVLAAHALTGSSRIHDWWPALAGPGKFLDPDRVQIIGINAIGSCYGSTGPAGTAGFPAVSVRDIVAAQRRALNELGIERLALVIGASLGGMQALQWALDFPQITERAVMVGSHDHQSAMGIALNALQREAIALDPQRGLRLARKIAMISYKSDDLFRERHDRRADRNNRFRFDVEGYLAYQGAIFEARMDPYSYVALTHAMDSFDVRGRAVAALEKPRLDFVGISSDWLFRPADVRAAAERFKSAGFDARYSEISSSHGHDAFLAEPEKLAALLVERP